jgi:flagellar hook-associated protein 3 FlgL
VLNAINTANPGALARISSDGRGVEVLNRVSGADLSIQENGGTAATTLGIRSMNMNTPLAELNDGRGVDTVPGNDLRVNTRSGAAIEIDVDGAVTLKDLIDRLNAAGGGAITAGLVTNGNGIFIRDNTAGANTTSIERANLSPAIDSLGLNVTAVGNTLTGRDVNPVRVKGAFTALLELRSALENNDTASISTAAQKLEAALAHAEKVHGELASKARAMDERANRVDSETTAAQVLQGNVRDVDISEAMVRFSQLQNALQANLQTAARVMNLSLLDYLR